MSFADLLSPESQTATLPALPYNPTGTGDVIAAAYDALLDRGDVGQARRYMADRPGYEDQRKLIQERFGEDVRDIYGEVRKEFPAYGIDATLEEYQSRIDRRIMEGREADPAAWEGIKTSFEIDQNFREAAQVRQAEFERTAGRASPAARLAGTLIGGVGAAFTSPINLATLPLGFGASRGILQTMWREGALNAAIEAAQVPMTAELQRYVGFDYTPADAALDVATAGMGGAAITGAVRGVAPAIRATGEASFRALDRIAQSERLPASARAAAQYLSRSAHIDEELPPGLREATDALNPNVGRETTILHRQAVQETQDAIRNFREPNYPAEFMGLRDFSFRATQELSPENASRVLRRFDEPVAILEEARFGSRAEADAFIRLAARDEGARRTDYLVERTADGQVAVVRAYRGLKPLADEQGAVVEFPSNVAAKAEAARLTQQGQQASAVSLNPKAKKAEQKHIVVLGATPEQAAKIKGRPELATFYDPARTTATGGPARAEGASSPGGDAKPAPDADLVKRPAAPAESLRQAAVEGEGLSDTLQADFARLLRDRPEMKLLVDGEEKSLADIAKELEEDDAVLNAIRTCGIG